MSLQPPSPLRRHSRIVGDMGEGETPDRHALLVTELTKSLKLNGAAHVHLEHAEITGPEWIRIAHDAADTLGRPIRTVTRDNTITAWLTDWPLAPPSEPDA